MGHSFMVGLLGTNSLCFPLFVNVWLSPLFQEDRFAGYTEFWVDNSFFHPLKTGLPLPPGLRVSDEKPAVGRIYFLTQARGHFFLTAFRNVFLCLHSSEVLADVVR